MELQKPDCKSLDQPWISRPMNLEILFTNLTASPIHPSRAEILSEPHSWRASRTEQAREGRGGLARAKAGNPNAAWTIFLHSSTRTALCTSPPPHPYWASVSDSHPLLFYEPTAPPPLWKKQSKTHTHTRTHARSSLVGRYSAVLGAGEQGSKSSGFPSISVQSPTVVRP